ncbi:8-oxo-dGTP diphosphatase [Microbacterium sp. CFBP9034]|uniref:8-oxo-dGTP diphosphatase n=1 Tax=Microbacterium sp. CFBP9034 TaxID=3096540 RepID=UPI002A6AF77B|nr:NUDIX domain-containing protein [Microbacterium sp. CFBP9034]MDY0908700.1 NUDIX domain-containing protein [Microbacterium sp. CFBP9034]
MTLPEVCVVLLLRTGATGLEVLLGEKRRGLGRGKVLGVAGRTLHGEALAAAGVREVRDQVGVEVAASDLHEAGTIEYHFPTRTAWSCHATVLVCRRWSGEPVETAPLSPRWYPAGDLPYARMWGDTPRWLPAVLRGGRVDARYTFGPDLATVVLDIR